MLHSGFAFFFVCLRSLFSTKYAIIILHHVKNKLGACVLPSGGRVPARPIKIGPPEGRRPLWTSFLYWIAPSAGTSEREILFYFILLYSHSKR